MTLFCLPRTLKRNHMLTALVSQEARRKRASQPPLARKRCFWPSSCTHAPGPCSHVFSLSFFSRRALAVCEAARRKQQRSLLPKNGAWCPCVCACVCSRFTRSSLEKVACFASHFTFFVHCMPRNPPSNYINVSIFVCVQGEGASSLLPHV